MSFPSVVTTHVCEETANGTTHTIPGFSGTQSGDSIYAIFACRKLADMNVSVGGPGAKSYYKYDFQDASTANKNISIVEVYSRLSGTDASNIVMTTSGGNGNCVAAGAAVLVRGARDQASEFIQTNGAINPPIFTGNPSLQVSPGGSALQSCGRYPNRNADGTPTDDAKLVAGFARVGSTTFSTTINDSIGSGVSDGAPYLAENDADMHWPSQPDGVNNSAFAVLDHAESDNGTWKVQVGLAHRDIASSLWGGHPTWDPAPYQGSVCVTYWPINGTGGGATAVPCASLGFRFRV